MTLGEKILICRKSKGLSQEELAAALGVSRQALSKWECNTSAPDIDNIIGLSNYFNVTTDYLLKDENINNSDGTTLLNGNIPFTISTALITLGLIIALAMANDGTLFLYWQFRSAALGIGIQIVGLCIFEVLYYSKHFELKSQHLFWGINIWLITIMPIIFISGILSRYLTRYDILHYAFYILASYLTINSILTFLLILNRKKRRKTT